NNSETHIEIRPDCDNSEWGYTLDRVIFNYYLEHYLMGSLIESALGLERLEPTYILATVICWR
ncbi:MAG: hypothetical protein WD991_02130, partial [Candidatus Paceibacterota bacterium]